MAQREELERPWVPLNAACRLLEVNASTLRHWADTGRIRAFRTLGGHRRFLREDIATLLETRSGGGEVPNWEELALRRIRRRLHGGKDASVHSRFEGVDGPSRGRMQVFGRRLGTLVMETGGGRRRQEILEEARLIGREQAAEMVRLGFSLREVLEAFLFFRDTFLDAAREAPARLVRPEELLAFWHRVNVVSDQVLLGVAEAFEAGAMPPVALAANPI